MGFTFNDDYIVTLAAETKAARRNTSDFFRSIADGADASGKSVEDMEKSFFKMSAAAGAAVGLVLKAFDLLVGAAIKAGQAVIQFTTNFISQGVQMNATLQTLMISFTNITGSEERAVALLGVLRERAALLGLDFTQLAQTFRGLVPFAQGDVDTVENMLTLVQQLAILDPVAGVRGAGRALREALAGQTRALASIFELPRDALNELQKEFRETGDVEVFIQALSDLVSAAGSSAADIEAFAGTFQGSIIRIQFEFKELQRLAGAPIMEALQRNLATFSEAFLGNIDLWKRGALTFGAIIAVTIDLIGAFVQAVLEGINAWETNAEATVKIVELITERIDNFTVSTILNVVAISLQALNTVITEINKVAESLGLEPIAEATADLQQLEATIRSNLEEVRAANRERRRENLRGFDVGGVAGLVGPTGVDFNTLVRQRVGQFEDLLNVNENGLDDLGEQNREFEEDDMAARLEFNGQIRDVVERNNENIEKETDRHHQKLTDIQERAQEEREDALEDAAKKLEDINSDFDRSIEDARIDLARKLEDIDADVEQDRLESIEDTTDKLEEIEENHAKTVENIRKKTQAALFDAVNARDARRVFDILQQSRKQVTESEAERKKRIQELKKETDERQRELADRRNREREEAQQDFERELQDLALRRERRLQDLTQSLQEELQKIDMNLAARLQAEFDNHRNRLRMLSENMRQRLFILARGWAEQGKITQEGLNRVFAAAVQMYGPQGEFLSLYGGFNNALLSETNRTQQILQRAASAVGLGGGRSALGETLVRPSRPSSTDVDATANNTATVLSKLNTGIASAIRGLQGAFGGRVIGAQTGFEGIIREPTTFTVGEGFRPERVSIVPINNDMSSRGSGEDSNLNVHVTADSNFPEGFAADLSVQIAREVGAGMAGRRRSRRG